MDKDTKALIDFYDNQIKELKTQKNQALDDCDLLQHKLDKIEEYVNTNIKKINPKNLSNSELYMITPDTKIQRYYVCKDILQIIKGEDK